MTIPLRLRRALVIGVAELVVVVSLLLAVPAFVGAQPSSAANVSAPPGSRYSVPLSPRPTVVRGFDEPTRRWQPGHRGIDLATTSGTAVLAAGDGIVRFAGIVAGKPTVSIEHDDGVITTYEPVRAGVRRGVRVRRGQAIGTIEAGHPGCTAAACLHWGARRGSGRAADYLNPLALLGAVRVRLKPLDGPVSP
ncbi:putative peptidase, M23 family [Gordonia polyisoprenivorans VH2]|uniref:Putative peptidase, M23 family n=1 Tax=Gordonia polyisoprenivorans (strain DSM 44266 / VH2) TaxID=1112204 RepID=H6MY10_GORPV|nr:peptidoglycan DD-metalloendopeptidase family protein [Gordonia polyisoprenivorans]AFA73042.1 putative peptidase, M23 family [Gordonia polyisoprenivorans VH2]QUD85426.1 M23 family metallopeptidase [Gordonia polyisoprenivorans]